MAHHIHNRAFDVPPDEAYLEDRERRHQVRAEVAALTAQVRAATALKMPLVYGALRKEAPVVKIGTSVILPSRASWPGRLARFGGIDQARLVAVMHGDHQTERAVHQRLASARVRMDDLPGTGVTEHFRITDEVVEWINETRVAIGLDPVTSSELLDYSA